MSVYDLAKVITAHAWSPDRSKIAVCENENVVYIYSGVSHPNPKNWKKEHILDAHSMIVCGIDWCPLTNKIVTCSHDINAFVWTYDGRTNTWSPSLSILRINRAALSARWSPDGTKFAVASGSKVVPVCYYEQQQDWWVSKMIKKHKSTVIDVAWHPTSQLLATASSDFKCRIFSAFIADREQPARTFLGDMSQFQFGDLITEFDSSNGWVEGVAWSPSGEVLAFCGHDSSISIVTFAGGQPACRTIRTKSLPYTQVLFLSDSVLVAAGHEFYPDIYQASGQRWSLLGPADVKAEEKPGKLGALQGGGGQFTSSKKIWETKVKTGQTANTGAEDLWTKHHNVITRMCIYSETQRRKSYDAFSTSGGDGKIVIWKADDLKKAVSGLSL